MELDMTKLEPLLGTMVNELGAAANAALVLLGDKLGLYRALARSGPATAAELAKRANAHERYVSEWLAAQAASGFVTYDAASDRFSMSPEQAAVLADDNSPVNMLGGFSSLAAIYADEQKLERAFLEGTGIDWGEHCSCLFCGVARFFRPGYKAHLVTEWIPALHGVRSKLEQGARVADVGCGHGVSTAIMAEAFPRSEFTGIDFHEASIDEARKQSKGIENISFKVAGAQNFDDEGLDFVTLFDALHDMGDPVGVAKHVRKALTADGTLMLVEPMAGDQLADNMNPVGRVYYAFSTSICVPTSLGQPVAAALGAQAGEKRLREVLQEAGFTRIRRAAETPFNMVIEARP